MFSTSQVFLHNCSMNINITNFTSVAVFRLRLSSYSSNLFEIKNTSTKNILNKWIEKFR